MIKTSIEAVIPSSADQAVGTIMLVWRRRNVSLLAVDLKGRLYGEASYRGS